MPFLWYCGMKFKYLSLIKYFHIILITSASMDDKNKYKVNMAAFDHIFKQHINAKIGIMKFMINFLFFDNLLLFKAYLTLKCV